MSASDNTENSISIRELNAEDLDRIGGGGSFDLGQIFEQVLDFVSNVATGAPLRHWTGPRVQ